MTAIAESIRADGSRLMFLFTAALLTAVVRTLLTYRQPPSATLLNQCPAVAL